jgi:pyruvate/2-oxoglutarate dehydrogenase complex dihydrolipoamide dehydrogenase (E3) component
LRGGPDVSRGQFFQKAPLLAAGGRKMNYDIIVLGAGSAGLNIASFMNTIKLKVLMVEKHLIGGDCLNYGCVPSKVLISLAHTVDYARKAEGLGFRVEGTVDMKKIAGTIAARQDVIRIHENPGYFRDKGIDVEIGIPRFISTNAISINNKKYNARRIVIATGSRPAIPPILGLDTVDYFTNESIFTNRELPGTLLVIGGGHIGIELAQAYQRLGSQVIVLDLLNRILPREDKDISENLLKVLQKEGIDFRLGVKPVKFLDKNTLVIKSLKNEDTAEEETITFDRVLVAAGRRLNIEELDLEKAGVEVKNSKIVVDKFLRTTNKKIYCCGDVAGEFLFTHWAEYQAAVVIKNMLRPFKKAINRSLIAWVTFTDPEVASFGLSTKEIEEKGISYKTISIPVKELDRAICEGIVDGVLKVRISKGKIMGGTLMVRNAGEIVGELIGFMSLKLPFSRLYNRIYPYPTLARIHRKAVQKYLGEKLTPRAIGVLNKLYRLFN